MNQSEIKTRYEQLSNDLRDALSRMELTDKVYTIRDEIKQLQALCPHGTESYDFSDQERCPYCGKKLRK